MYPPVSDSHWQGYAREPTLLPPCRYLLRDAMSGYMRAKWKKWDVLDRAIQEEGWKLLLLLRLSPAVPYNVLNIAMALTGMNFWVFSVTSFFGEGMDVQGGCSFV